MAYKLNKEVRFILLYLKKVIYLTSLIEKGLDYYLYIKFICLYLIKLILTILINN